MQSFLVDLVGLWDPLAVALTVLLSIIASAHVVLYKRDSRAAVGWVGLIWLVPIVGAVLYALLGINRIRRQAVEQRGLRLLMSGEFPRAPVQKGVALPPEVHHLHTLAELVDRVASRPLTTGNAVQPLVNGDQAYPAMLAAIDGANQSIGLSTYIFDSDDTGRQFQNALERAVNRGVAVRILIDTVGARYSWPPIVRELKRRKIPVASFGRTLLPWRMPYFNLRNHRKLLIVDGKIGFTGGMNIRAGHVLENSPKHPVQDLQFRIEGPVVAHAMQTFAEDWAFTTKEQLSGEAWFPRPADSGTVVARGINDGPDEDFERARFVFLGALACAQKSVRIVTPYFLPDQGLISALDVAALRGVQVDIILPEVNNLALVHWAATAQLWQVLARGCRVFYTAPPFDHSKVMLVDGGWALFGSTNWDPRSLRLNFEFGVECYNAELVRCLDGLVGRKLEHAREVTAEEVNSRSLPVRLRDGLARLAAPYL
ncbi:MAG: cardiolipin synthase [Gemmatimonadales bacterium]|nr:cardiolipin synthase [Gemmatimonadales bacterium]NIN13406.1 cardiolipin synthase [Gemmatimonadales bacterium]NIN51409.1 cardiolipin synthase [Gemmatimonadales bacterium]NIP08873.1 cardiolipin synthase [Gemmatimonadales bacterium]NIQ99867.1 cardiolipin synthase [Gemmatimonadales bacterium]